MKNIIGVIIALILIIISLLAAFFLWENSPNERLRVEHTDNDHYPHINDHDHSDVIPFSDEQIPRGK